jgi:hypothetical protein
VTADRTRHPDTAAVEIVDEGGLGLGVFALVRRAIDLEVIWGTISLNPVGIGIALRKQLA